MSRSRAYSAGTRPAIVIALALILFLAINLVASLKLGQIRADLTERSLYTLSAGSQKIIGDLTEPVTIRLFETRQLLDSVAALQTFSVQVHELLRTVEQASDGKVHLEVTETLPFSAEEDQAIGFGLAGFSLSRAGERGYFGLVGTNTLDTLETVQFLDPAREGFLQYDLSRLIYRLSRPRETQVAIIDGLSMYGSMTTQRRPWAILDLIGQDYSAVAVPAGADAVPPGTDVLLVAHPATLSATQQFAIDQYVLGGGSALIFVDPLAENSPPDVSNPGRPQNPSSSLERLAAAWGVRIDPAKVVGDRTLAMETVGVAGQQRVVADYLPWLRLSGEAFNSGEPMTARLQAMRMSSAGSITTLPDATTRVTTLIQSTANSMLLDRDLVMQRPNPNRLLESFVASGQPHALAVRVTGPVHTAFPDGRPANEQGADQPQLPGAQADPPLVDAVKPINVILVADSDLLADSHVIGSDGRVTTSNADFVLNALGDLAGGDALIDVRGGGQISRPFATVQAMQDKAEASYRATEQRLSQELADIQQQLLQLQGHDATAAANPVALSRDQQAEVTRYNLRIADLRGQLREVRRALRADIDALNQAMQFINIALVPVLLIVGTALLAFWRKVRVRDALGRYKLRQLSAGQH